MTHLPILYGYHASNPGNSHVPLSLCRFWHEGGRMVKLTVPSVDKNINYPWYTALMSKLRNVSGLKNNIELLWNDQNLRNKMALNAESVYNKNHNVTQWVDYVKANLE
jgi:hypothetical protein